MTKFIFIALYLGAGIGLYLNAMLELRKEKFLPFASWPFAAWVTIICHILTWPKVIVIAFVQTVKHHQKQK